MAALSVPVLESVMRDATRVHFMQVQQVMRESRRNVTIKLRRLLLNIEHIS